MVQQLFLHEPERIEGVEPLFVGAFCSERVVDVGNTTDATIGVNLVSLEHAWVAGAVFAFVMLHYDEHALFCELVGFFQDPVTLIRM